jgi:deoxyribodipyrimidine photo-lyase
MDGTMSTIDARGPTRAARAAALATQLDGLFEGPPTISPTVGGRAAALRALQAFDVRGYATGRNYVVNGAVSRLAPYLRHGVITLAEVRDDVLRRAGTGTSSKFISELAWRFFWHLIYRHEGDRIYTEMEQPKYNRPRARELPADVAAAATGLTCMDRSLQDLYTTGYMHNHARMWFASYLVHHRGVHFSIGATLFDRHLLCGDPAPNWLSWQWVDSSFSHKPYIFNKDNVYKFSRGAYCAPCPARDACPFDAPYPVLWARLFGAEMPDR